MKKKYTAYDLFNNLVKSEDIYENKSSLGLNKHVQKKFNNVDAIENITDYVDLGLPSGTLWCKHNYGVASEEEYGKYYTFDDAQKLDATVPSSDEFSELYMNCKHELAVVNGVRGQLFTSELNGGTVFFPAAGNDGKQIGIRGYYWTSNRYPPYSGFCFSFSTNMFNPITSLPTQNGFAVRTIMKRTNESNLGLNKHVQDKFKKKDILEDFDEFVDLGLPSGTLWKMHDSNPRKRKNFCYTWREAVNISKKFLEKDNECLPTSEEIKELIDNCTAEFTEDKCILTSKLNGNVLTFKRHIEDGEHKGHFLQNYWSCQECVYGMYDVRKPDAKALVINQQATNSHLYVVNWTKTWQCYMRTVKHVNATNESKTTLGLNKHVQKKFEEKDMLEDFDEFVDLGIPSGVRWAKHNVGATTEEEYGDYYSYKDIDKLSRGNVRVPTNIEWNDLKRYCTIEFVSFGDGKNGLVAKSKEDPSKYIFLPSAGFERDGKAKSIVANGISGAYMLSNIYRYTFQFNSSMNYVNFQSVFDFDICRFSVRMVEYPEKKKKSKKIEESSHLGLNKRVQKKFKEKDAIDNISDYVDLGLPSGNLWCKYNVGANSEKEYGDYFKHHQALEIDTKEGVLPLTHDFLELSLHCEETDETVNGVKCHVFTSKQNRERLCFPAAGLNGVKKNELGSYWAEEPYDKSDNRSCCMSFSLNGVTHGHKAYNDNFNNANELSVKLVLKKDKIYESSTSLGLNKRIQKKFEDKDSVENVSWIPFEDKEVEKVCHEHGVYTFEDAASVTTIIDETQWHKPSWFYDHKIKTFNEFKYFTGLKIVERHAFNFNTTLESITLPSSIETIGFGAFKDCHNLVKVTMQEGLKTIKTCAFDNCRHLKTLVFPEGLEEIESLVIEGCSNIKSVNIPDSVSYIAPTAFNECDGSLNTIYISSNHHLRSALSKNCPHIVLVDPKEVNESNLGLNKHVQKKFKDIDAVDNVTEYVDLGLPSGTLWKAYNEGQEDISDDMLGNTYTQPEAIKEFRDLLPSKDQYEELISQCDWKIVVIDGKKMIEFRSKSNGKALYFQIKPLIQFWSSDEYVYDDFTAGYGFIPIAGIEICPKVYKYSKANDFFVRTVIRKSTSEEKVNESDLGLNKHVQKKFQEVDAVENINDYVDLGLPSGTLWCKNNYDEKGGYFNWYEVRDLNCDVIINHIPDVSHFKELCRYCNIETTKIGDMRGKLFTSKINGNSIFFPALGYYWTGEDPNTIKSFNENGYYWSSAYSTAMCFFGNALDSDGKRDVHLKFCVRTISKKTNESISLGLNKHVQKKFNDVDAVDNVSQIPFEDPEVARICHEHGVYTVSDARKVTSIKEWFNDNDNIKSFNEFKYFTGLKDIDAFFYRCKSLQSITIHDNVTSIGKWAFAWCKALQSVTIPNSVTSIGDYAFYLCKSLQSVIIPDGVTSIKESAFEQCSSLQSINIPDSVTSIGDDAFYDCESLQSINIPDSVTNIGYRAFTGCKALQSVTIPNSVTSIGERAFELCSSLQSINIPDSVTSIGDDAFYDCESLQSLYISKNCPVYDQIKKQYPAIQLIDPKVNEASSLGLNKHVQKKFNDADAVDNVSQIPFEDPEVERICHEHGVYTIEDAANVTSIFDGNEGSINSGWFRNSNIKTFKEFKYFKGLKEINNFAFSGCKKLSILNIPENVRIIRQYSLDDSPLKELVIYSRNLESIEFRAVNNADRDIYISKECPAYEKFFNMVKGSWRHHYYEYAKFNIFDLSQYEEAQVTNESRSSSLGINVSV